MLLTNYGNLDDIYRRIDEIPSKYVEALLEHKEIAYLSRKLATICQDVPLQLDFSKHHFRFDQLLTKEVQNLFQEWNFRSLLDKIADNKSLEQTSLFLPEEPQKGEDIQVHEISPEDLE
jgi:DNA polymerase I